MVLLTMKFFCRDLFSGTRDQPGITEECASCRFSDFVTSSDKAFALLVFKNKEFLGALFFSDDAGLKSMSTRELKRRFPPRYTTASGSNCKDNGESDWVMQLVTAIVTIDECLF
jgi:hypothetical protein